MPPIDDNKGRKIGRRSSDIQGQPEQYISMGHITLDRQLLRKGGIGYYFFNYYIFIHVPRLFKNRTITSLYLCLCLCLCLCLYLSWRLFYVLCLGAALIPIVL